MVTDAEKDERFSKNPLVTGSPHVRFLCGRSHYIHGRLCIGRSVYHGSKAPHINTRSNQDTEYPFATGFEAAGTQAEKISW